MSNVQRVSLQPAYLLHQRAYRDTSVIIDVITPEYGRIALVAKGVRQAKSKLKGLLRPFQPLLISWVARGELGTLTRAEAQGRMLNLAAGLIPCGFYVNELMMRLLHQHDPHIELFSYYDDTLRGFEQIDSQSQKQIQSRLRHFEVSLLQSLGYALMLDHDQHHALIQPEQEYRYTIERGPLPVPQGETGDEEAGMTVNGATLQALANLNLSPAIHNDENFRQAKRLMRTVLDHYLDHKPLHSRQLLTGQRKMPLISD